MMKVKRNVGLLFLLLTILSGCATVATLPEYPKISGLILEDDIPLKALGLKLVVDKENSKNSCSIRGDNFTTDQAGAFTIKETFSTVVITPFNMDSADTAGKEDLIICRKVDENYTKLVTLKADRLENSLFGNKGVFIKCDFKNDPSCKVKYNTMAEAFFGYDFHEEMEKGTRTKN